MSSLLGTMVLRPASGRRRCASLKRSVGTSTSTSGPRRLNVAVNVTAVSSTTSSSSSSSSQASRFLGRPRVTRAAATRADDVAEHPEAEAEKEEECAMDEEENVSRASGAVELDAKESGGKSAELLVLSAVLTNALHDTAAYAYEGYDGIGVPDDEATPLQNAFGLVFTIFCGWYFLRVVKKRGNRAKEFRVANTLPKEERELRDAEQLAKAKKLSAKDSFIGGVTGLGISFVLYGFAQTISASFDGREVPDSYQVRQITITVRTIVTGLAYLATFVYAANGTGLVALAAQKTLDKLTVGEERGREALS